MAASTLTANAAPKSGDGQPATVKAPVIAASARQLVKDYVRLQPIQASGGAKYIGLEGKKVTVTSDGVDSTITLANAAPFARIRPFTGKPYVSSVAELPARFSSLLGPSPSLVLTYGSGTGQRNVTVEQQASIPTFDLATQTISVTVPGKVSPLSARNGILRFYATSPDRPVARGSKGGTRGKYRNSCPSETEDGWGMSQTCPDGPFTVSVLGNVDPNQPPPMLTATQQTYQPLGCVTYPASGATSSGGTLMGASTLTTEQTSTDVAQSLNAGTTISASYGALSTGLTGSYTSSDNQDSNSVYAVAKVFVSGLTSTLTPTVAPTISGKSISTISDALSVLAQCGDAIATSYTSGAAYTSVLRMETYDESSAESLSASLSASYGPDSAKANFASTVTNDQSVTDVTVSDVCLGVASCQDLPGYVPTPAKSATESNTQYVSEVMNAFTSTFGSVQQGLGGLCQSEAQDCVISMTYSPIEDAITGSGQSLVSSASTGVYWMLFNAQAWANAYQSLSTAYANAQTYQESLQTGTPEVDVYTQSSEALGGLATTYAQNATNINRWISSCAGVHLADSACAPIYQGCISAYASQGTSAPACTPTAVSTLVGISDPSKLSGPLLATPAQTCNDTSAYKNSIKSTGSGSSSVTLYLGGVQSLSYPAFCVWTYDAATLTQTTATYLPVTATSQANGQTTTYTYVPFDPLTGTIYVAPFATGNKNLDPQCPSGCLPLGMADVTGGTSYQVASTFDVVLPPNLVFAATTNLAGDGTANLAVPGSLGVQSNEWKATQAQAGTAYLVDSSVTNDQGIPDEGILLVTGKGASLSSPPTGLPPAPVACELGNWSGSDAPPTFAYDSQGNCLITVTGHHNVGGGNTDYNTYYAQKPGSSGAYYYPATICGGRSNGGGTETINSYNGASTANQTLKVRYYNTYDSTVTVYTTLTYSSAPPLTPFPGNGSYVDFCGSTTPLKGK